jgi:hypothetical protein
MSTNCTHTLATGEACNAPAVSGTPFCRHHYPQLPLKDPKPSPPVPEKFELPPIRDKDSILAAIIEVLNAMADRRIKRSEAETFIRGLKFAARLMTEIDEECIPSFPTHQLHPAQSRSTMPNFAPQQPRNQTVAGQPALTTNKAARSDCSVALAAFGDCPKATSTFNPARRAGAPPLYPEHASSLDPSTARLVKGILAQSHQLASSQKAKS